MINRKQIEQEIDALLDNITDEEIVLWFDAQTNTDLQTFLGEGSYLEIKPCTEFIQDAKVEKLMEFIDIEPSKSYAGEQCFGIAA